MRIPNTNWTEGTLKQIASTTMSDYSVETTAYVKLLLHAAKFPANACSGLLVGEEQGQGFVITDAVPLFHHAAPLAPLLEVACAVVDTWCQSLSPRHKIVGLYYAGAALETTALSHFTEKLADKIDANCSRACVLLVDNQQLSSDAKSAVQVRPIALGSVRVYRLVDSHPYKRTCASLALAERRQARLGARGQPLAPREQHRAAGPRACARAAGVHGRC